MSTTNQLPASLNLAFVEELYAQYHSDPNSVPPEWRSYFATMETGGGNGNGNGAGNGEIRLGPSFVPVSLFNAGPPILSGPPLLAGAPVRSAPAVPAPVTAPISAPPHVAKPAPPAPVVAAAPGRPSPSLQRTEVPLPSREEEDVSSLQDRVDQLIRAFRVRGHMIARLDPLGMPRQQPPELHPKFYGFSLDDMDRRFSCETMHTGGPLPLHEILTRLRNTYCRWIGVQFMHIDDIEVRNWLQERMESVENRIELTREEQIRILTRLTDAVAFEEFIRRKFVGAKSFSLEGAESLVPLLDLAIEKASEQGIDEIVMGMAHRGRLNVLVNIIGKSPSEIFREFEDKDPDLHLGGGDVKYHLGYASDWETAAGKKVHLALCFNPSHLEYVNPVAMGRLRAKQDRTQDYYRKHGLVLLIHGDAAFAGEGVVQETLNLSQLPGYTVGGTLHVVVNNQIGFTTSPSDARSSTYATDVAKMLQIPIFHVNGENPEAVAQVVRLALDFRATFERDVVIDMYCYRRLGHNEADEPAFTQPKMYRAIEGRMSVREAYLQQLLKMQGVSREEADTIAEHRRAELEAELSEARNEAHAATDRIRRTWGDYAGGPESLVEKVDTSVSIQRLGTLMEALAKVPDDFNPHAKIKRFLTQRAEMGRGERPLDWSAGEALAFASLLEEGTPVRLSGQDSQRGTFSQRHSVLHDAQDDHAYMSLRHVSPHQAQIQIYNSPLSEVGVLGFEYGYSLDCLDGLTLWEAQFGDFWNAAQVIVDQFIVSAEDKWHHLSGIVLLLPHGFEGMGPEHSSARLERFLSMAADDNMQIVYPTTPAQFFHLLRRQVLRKWRKPLIVMSPKSLLRHIEAVSSLEELATGSFQRILPDALPRPAGAVKRILLCTGKIYYELDKQREALGRDDVAILRVEQLYPLSDETLQTALAPYADGTPVVWVQEEPENMGAWRYLKVRFCHDLYGRMPFFGVYRPASSSPATGSAGAHKMEQELILAQAFGG